MESVHNKATKAAVKAPHDHMHGEECKSLDNDVPH